MRKSKASILVQRARGVESLVQKLPLKFTSELPAEVC
jgi:hypothetical protein